MKLPHTLTRFICATKGHPDRRCVSQNPHDLTFQYWCPRCDVYWYEK